MLRLLKLKLTFIGLVIIGGGMLAQTQNWVPSSKGLLQSYQLNFNNEPSPNAFNIQFKTKGPFGKDWIYGHWLDSDSLFRCVGTRVGGKWVPLPFHVDHNSWTGDIVQYGDTMYIGGYFHDIVLDKDSSSLPWTSLLKVYGDSIWSNPPYFFIIRDMEVSGDSILVWADGYQDSTVGIESHMLSTDGRNWRYPYSITHPVDSVAFFGAEGHDLEIWKGDIITLNDNGPGPYNGIIRWDGNQWHPYGPGIRGPYSMAFDFEIFRDEIYMSGGFTKAEHPLNPGEFIARWDGQKWNEVGGGLQTSVWELFVYNDLLYCHGVASGYGDANIPYLAAWDGHKWCGTPIHYTNARPGHFGFVNDTLWAFFGSHTTTTTGNTINYLNYFDGDYLHGPNAICSTPGLGEEEIETVQSRIVVYPNPASSKLMVQLSEVGAANLKLFDLKGALVLSRFIHNGEAELQLPKGLIGVYVVEITTEKQFYTQKVVVQNE